MGTRSYDDPFGLLDTAPEQEAPKPISKKPDQGFVSSLVSGLGEGLAGLPKQLVTDPLRALGILDTPDQATLQARAAEENARQVEREGLSGMAYETGRMAPASIAPSLTGAGIGALLGGTILPGIGAIPGALLGTAFGGAAGGPLFGLSQAQSTKEEAIRRGVDPGLAPLWTGLEEAIGETISGALPGGILAKLGKRVAGKALVKPLIGLAAGEVLPEMAQAGSQAATERAYGIRPEANPMQEMIDTIGPTLMLSGLIGGGVAGANRLMPKKMPEGYGEKALGTDVTLQMPNSSPPNPINMAQQPTISPEGIPQPTPETIIRPGGTQGLETGELGAIWEPDSYGPVQKEEVAGLPYPDDYRNDPVAKTFEDMKQTLSSMDQGRRQAVANNISRFAPDLSQEDQGRLAEIVSNGRHYEAKPAVDMMTGKAQSRSLEDALPSKKKGHAKVAQPSASINIEGAPTATNAPRPGGLPGTAVVPQVPGEQADVSDSTWNRMKAEREAKKAAKAEAKAAKTAARPPRTPQPAPEVRATIPSGVVPPTVEPVASPPVPEREPTDADLGLTMGKKNRANARRSPTRAPKAPTSVAPEPSAPVAPVAAQSNAIADAEDVRFVNPDKTEGVVKQTTPTEKLDKRHLFAFMNKKTGEVRQDKEGTSHAGWNRAGIKESELDDWIGGWTQNGKFETGEMMAARDAREKKATEQEAFNTNRTLHIKTLAERTIPNQSIRKVVDKAVANLGENNEASFQLTGREGSQAYAAIKSAALRSEKKGVQEGNMGGIGTKLGDNKFAYSFSKGNNVTIEKNASGGYNVNFTTELPVTKSTQAEPVAAPKPTGVAPEQVVQGRGVELEEGSPEVVHSGKMAKAKVQDRNAHRSLLEGMHEPAVAYGGRTIVTPTKIYRIEREGRNSVARQVGENTPDAWAETLRKWNPDSNSAPISTNKAYRAEHAANAPSKEKPSKETPKKSRPVPVSQAAKVEPVKKDREKAKARIKAQLGKKEEPKEPEKKRPVAKSKMQEKPGSYDASRVGIKKFSDVLTARGVDKDTALEIAIQDYEMWMTGDLEFKKVIRGEDRYRKVEGVKDYEAYVDQNYKDELKKAKPVKPSKAEAKPEAKEDYKSLKSGHHYEVSGILQHRGKPYEKLTIGADYIGWAKSDGKIFHSFRHPTSGGTLVFVEDSLEYVKPSRRDEFNPTTDIKSEGRTMSSSRVEVKFPRAEDMDRGNISIKLDGVEKANLPASDLADVDKVAKLISKIFHKAHGGSLSIIENYVMKEMTGGTVKSEEAKGKGGKAKGKQGEQEESKEAKVAFMITADAKQQLYDLGYSRDDVANMKPSTAQDILAAGTTKPKEIKTKAAFVTKRFGGHLTLKEFASTIPNEQMKSFTSFLNRMRETLDMSPSAFAELRSKVDLNELYQNETSKKIRLVQQNIANLKKKFKEYNEVVVNGSPNVDLFGSLDALMAEALDSVESKGAAQKTDDAGARAFYEKYGNYEDAKSLLSFQNGVLKRDGHKIHLVNPTAEQALWAKVIQKVFKSNVVFVARTDMEGKPVSTGWSGKFMSGSNTMLVNVNSIKFKQGEGAQKLIAHTVGHEISHAIEEHNPSLWAKLHDKIMALPGAEEEFRTFANSQYAKSYQSSQLRSEFIADMVGRGLYEKKLWNDLAESNDPGIMRALHFIRDKIQQILDTMSTWLRGRPAISHRMQYTEYLYNHFSEARDAITDTLFKYAKARNNNDLGFSSLSTREYNEITKHAPQSLKNWMKGGYFFKDGNATALHHGTIRDIKGDWVTDRKSGSLDQRLGAQFAVDPKLAGEFSFGKYTDFSMARNKESLLYDAMSDTYHLPGGRVYQVFSNVKNPKDLRSSSLEDWQQIQHDAFMTLFKDGKNKQLFIDTYENILGYSNDSLQRAWSDMQKNGTHESFFMEHDLPHFAEIDPANKKAMTTADIFTMKYKNELKKQGYDSILYTHTDHEIELSDPTAVIVFEPDSVQTVIDNMGKDSIELAGSILTHRRPRFTYQRPRFAQADEEFEKNRGLGVIGTWDRIKEFAKGAYHDFTRQFTHLDPAKYGDIANTLYKFKYSGDYGKKIAADMIKDTTRGLDAERYNVFRRMVVMPDLINYMRSLQNNPELKDQPVMGFRNVQEAEEYFEHYKRIALRDPAITEALHRRKVMMESWRQKMVDAKLLPKHVLEKRRADYYRHQILAWMGAKAIGKEPSLLLGTQGEGVRLRRASWQRARKGSLHSYNTEYIEAEFEVLAQGIQQLEAKAALDHLKQYDMSDRLRAAWKLQKDTPGGEKDFKLYARNQGFSPWKPKEGNYLHKTWTLTDKALDRVMRHTQDLATDLRGLKRETVQGLPLPEWYLPQDVAKQLDQLEPPPDESALGKATANTLGMWKQWVLFNPLRLTKYILNNTSGDLDIAIAYDPKILKYAYAAMKDLYAYTKDPSSMPMHMRKQLDHALKQRVIDSGITIEEIGTMSRLSDADMFKFLDNRNVALWKKAGGSLGDYMKFVKKWANYRENILRLAAYRYFQEKVASGQRVYGASKRQEIDNISDADDKAAKLARELIGDYGNISKSGQWIRKHMIPFWSWLEINAPRYFRMLQNTKYESDSNLLGALGRTSAVKAVSLGAKAGALFFAINLFNRIFWPDEDDELRKTGRQQLHIILGRREDGTIRTLRFQGALSDALSWVGLENMGQDFTEIVSGRKALTKQIKEMAIAPFNKVVLGARPVERTLSEMALGRTMWPDITNPRPIRDKLEHLAKSVSLDIPYRYAAGKPTRGPSQDAEYLAFYRADTGEAAYYKTMQKARDYLQDKNIDLPVSAPTRRSNALYYYKQARKYGDKKAEQHWLEQFKKEGGKQQNIIQSIKKSHPIAFMPLKERRGFLTSLDKEDQEIYNMAVEWWTRTYRR